MSCLISFLNLFFLGTRGLNIPVSLTDTQGDGLHSHDVGFVDGGHARSFVVPGVLEGVLSDASASVLGDQFDALNNTVDDLRQQKDKKRTEVTHSWTEHNRITIKLWRDARDCTYYQKHRRKRWMWLNTHLAN